MFSLLLALFVGPNMWNKKFWLIIAWSHPHYKKDRDWSSVYSPRKGECLFSSKIGEVGKIVKEAFLLYQEEPTFAAKLCVYKSKVYTRATSSNKYIP